MKLERKIVVGLSIVVIFVSVAASQDVPELKGPYLNQDPPGSTPAVFSSGVISTDEVEACATFSFDGRFFVFRRGFREDTQIFLMENRNGNWTAPMSAPFFVKEYGFGDFTFSPNGPELYFTSRRPLTPGGQATDSANLWKIEYDHEGWLDPTHLGNTVNSTIHESYPSVSNDKTLYFFRRFDEKNGFSEIVFSEWKEGGYSNPKVLGPEINTQWDEWDPSVSPDGDFLIFCSKKPSGFGMDDLYVSFRREGGNWTEAVNLGPEINSDRSENRPFITADGKYLFFNSNVAGNRDVFWVDLDVVRNLRTVAVK